MRRAGILSHRPAKIKYYDWLNSPARWSVLVCRDEIVVDKSFPVRRKPVAAPTVLELRLRHPSVEAAPHVIAKAVDLHIGEAGVQEIIAERGDRKDHVNAIGDAFDQAR